MSDTKLGVRKATVLLRQDHERVKKLFSEYEALGEDRMHDKAGLFREIERELTIHATIEEEIFYPAVEVVRKGKTEGDEIVKEALEEHKIVKTLLAELSDLDAVSDTFEAKMKVLKENVLHHAEEEQADMFPLFEKLSKEEQSRVSQKLSDRKSDLE